MNEVKQYYGPCYSVGAIDEAEIVPIGGKNVLSNDLNVGVVADFSSFETLFSTAREIHGSFNYVKAERSLADHNIDVPAQDFLPLLAFTKALDRIYPERSRHTNRRHDLYFDGEAPKLSTVLKQDAAMCSEVALLAHKYLVDRGSNAKFVAGSVLWSRDDEFPEQHSFVAIERETDVLLYDPSNPTGGNPTVYKAAKENFARMESSKQPCFLIVTNAITKIEAGYGVSTGVNVVPERHFIENAAIPPKRQSTYTAGEKGPALK